MVLAAPKAASTTRLRPFTYELSSALRKTSAGAISEGVASRPADCAAVQSIAPEPIAVRNSGIIGLSIGPGLTQFMRMRPSNQHGRARSIVYTITHSFEKK